jgi:hypothetical protein
LWIPKISNPPASSPKLILKPDQTIIFKISAAKIDLLCTSLLAFLDQIPKKQWHAREVMESFVRTSILEHGCAAVLQRKDRGNGNAAFACQPDLNIGVHASNQVPKPGTGLRQKLMAPPGDHEQPIEISDKSIGAPFLIRKMFTLGSPNAALDTAFV